MIRKLPKISLWLLAALLLLAIAAFLLLVYTPAGLRFSLGMLPEKIGESRLVVRNVQGTLAGGFTAEYFELKHPRATVIVDRLRARVAVLPLLWQTIDVRDAAIDRAFVQIHTRKTISKWNMRFLPLFLKVRTEGLRIANATLVATNGKRFDGTEVVGSGTLRAKTIQLYEARARLQDLRGDGQLNIGAAEPIQLAGETHWVFAPAGQPVWTANIDANGDFAKLGIASRITAPFRAKFEGSVDALNSSDWHWGGKGQIEEFDLRAWGGGGLLGKITGQLAVTGNRDGFMASGPLLSAGLNVGLFDLQFEGAYANKVITARKLQLTHRSSHAQIRGAGDIGIETGGPRLRLVGSWRDFRWPLAGADPSVRSARGDYRLEGVWPYAVQLAGPLQVIDFKPFEMRIAGHLGHDRLHIDSGSLVLLGGVASVGGDAIWSPKESWQLSGQMKDMDTAQLRAALPGRVSFDYSGAGQGYGGGENLDAEFRNLSGRVRGAPARGGGKILRRGADWRFEQIKLAAGGLTFELDGVIAPQSRDLKFNVAASDLAILSPGSRGQVRANGSWRGPDSEPLIAVRATGRNIVYDGLQIGELDTTIDLDSRARQRSNIELRARQISLGGRSLQRLAFNLDGSTEANVARFEAQFAETVLRSVADGAFKDAAWRGRWRSMQVDDKDNLHLKLNASAAILLAADAGRIERFCLRGAAAQVCPQALWDPAAWQINLTAQDLPLDALTAGLTAKVIYDGTIGGELSVIGPAGGAIVGEVRARLRDARLRRLRPRGREDVLALGSGDLALDANNERLRGTLKLDAGALGFLDATLAATRRGASGGELNYADWPLQASLRGESRTLSFLSLLSQDIDRVGGKLVLDLGLGGTVGAPRADGKMRLSEGELDLYAINLAVRQLSAEAKIDSNRLAFESTSKVGAGSLAAGGNLYWDKGQIHGQLRLKGNDLLAVNVPEARILASPDLQFKLDGRRIEVTGEVKLPVAKIAPADLAGAVLTSNDEVLADAPIANDGSRTQIVSNIRMTLGDQVTLDTFGLSGRLTGSIVTRSADDGTTHATGDLSVAEGKYAAFGRRLDIERGRLQFNGGLVSDPAVDIRATKQYPEVIAGVNVRGTLQAPRMTFFSTPSLPQSQIVSLILAGNIDRAQDPNRAGAARDELLAQGGAIIAQQIGSRIGVDDVSIEQNLDSSTSLVLGKYLSPRLYFSYGISLAESINTLKMRYALDDRWTIRTESGKERSADLVYTIEK